MTDDIRSSDTTRPDDWTGGEWASDEAGRGTPVEPVEPAARPAVTDDEATAAVTDRWNTTQLVGDREGDGEGRPPAADPDTMPEGESDLSGFRHSPGEEHWAQGQSTASRTAEQLDEDRRR